MLTFPSFLRSVLSSIPFLKASMFWTTHIGSHTLCSCQESHMSHKWVGGRAIGSSYEYEIDEVKSGAERCRERQQDCNSCINLLTQSAQLFIIGGSDKTPWQGPLIFNQKSECTHKLNVFGMPACFCPCHGFTCRCVTFVNALFPQNLDV